MRLEDLEGEFIRLVPEGPQTSFEVVPSLAKADGVSFLCPLCYARNGGSRGTHSVLCWFDNRSLPAHLLPRPRWLATGRDLETLTLSPSVHLAGTCEWHGWVRSGSAA